MNKTEVLEKAKSYSAYRGITCSDRYDLTDEYIWAEVKGNIICTDKECDIDKDGNIVLVTPEFDVIHIGTVPMPETGKATLRMDAEGFLHIKYMCWYDNGRHHGDYVEETIDCSLNEDRKKSIAILKKAAELSALNIHGFNCGAYRNTFKIDENINLNAIELHGVLQKRLRYSMSKPQYARQMITYKDGKFELQPPVEGYLEVKEVIRNVTNYNRLIMTIGGENKWN